MQPFRKPPGPPRKPTSSPPPADPAASDPTGVPPAEPPADDPTVELIKPVEDPFRPKKFPSKPPPPPPTVSQPPADLIAPLEDPFRPKKFPSKPPPLPSALPKMNQAALQKSKAAPVCVPKTWFSVAVYKVDEKGKETYAEGVTINLNLTSLGETQKITNAAEIPAKISELDPGGKGDVLQMQHETDVYEAMGDFD